MFTYSMAYTEAGTYTNTVTATATDSDGDTATGAADATVTVTDVEPTIAVEKTWTRARVPETRRQRDLHVPTTNTSVEPVRPSR